MASLSASAVFIGAMTLEDVEGSGVRATGDIDSIGIIAELHPVPE